MLTAFDDLRVAVLCSRRAPGLDALLHHPQRHRLFDVSCVITSEPMLVDRQAIEDCGVPVLMHPIHRFHDECGASLRDMDARAAYDAMTVHVLQQLDVNCVVLLGYLYVVTDTLLNAFPGRVLNIHDSDLTIVEPNGERRYTGLHSTRDAILFGESETRSTVHFVTSKLDGGPILMRSKPYPVAPFVHEAVFAGATDVVNAYTYAHREWMMRDSWGALLERALEQIAAGVTDVEVAV